MKTFKFLGISLIAICLFTFNSCDKADEKVEEHEDNYPHSSIKSEEITVNVFDWSGDGNGYTATKPSSIITAEVASKGAVLCYLKDSGGEYMQLPLTLSLGQDAWITHFIYFYKAGLITFLLYDDDGYTPSPNQPFVYKVVVMENYNEAKNMGIDFNNYQEVKRMFNLKDN